MLSMSGECGPCASDPVLHLGGVLVHGCDHLPQILYFLMRRKYLDMHPVDFDFSCSVYFLVCQEFGSVWVEFPAPALLYLFEVRDQFVSCFKEAAIMSTSSAKHRFDMQSLFSPLSLLPKPFSFQVSMFSPSQIGEPN